MIRQTHEKDLLTTPYVFSAIDAKNMTEAGADIIVTHMGLTTGGDIGAKTTHSLEDCVELINDWAAAMSMCKDIIVLCHGDHIATSTDAQYILQHCPNCHGFYGASSMERLPA